MIYYSKEQFMSSDTTNGLESAQDLSNVISFCRYVCGFSACKLSSLAPDFVFEAHIIDELLID